MMPHLVTMAMRSAHAGDIFEGLTENRFAQSAAIDVGIVEKCIPRLERRRHGAAALRDSIGRHVARMFGATMRQQP